MTPAVTPQPAPQPTPPDQAINSVMKNDVTPTPAAAPPKQGFWRTLLMGAMNGLAGSERCDQLWRRGGGRSCRPASAATAASREPAGRISQRFEHPFP
jgi:hypothetical protein